MPQALIIEANMVVSCELSKRLAELGFDSFDQAWTEEEAVAMAERHPPDLVVVGDEIEEGDGVSAARRICEVRDTPVLLVTRDSGRIGERLAQGAVLDGPYSFSKLPETLCAAQNDYRPV